MSYYRKTVLLTDSSLLSHTGKLLLAMRRFLALIGLSISVSSAGVILLHAESKQVNFAEVNTSPETLNTVLTQNRERKFDMARAAIASGELERPVSLSSSKLPSTLPSTPTSNDFGVIIHEIKQDETLWQLTQMYQVDAASIAASNGISSATELQVGARLVIPPVDGLIHKVRKGETLNSIAEFYKVTRAEILKYSNVATADFLAIDQPLVIPGNVSELMQVKETSAKRKLFAERERLRQRLAQIEGKTTLVSNSPETNAPQITKPAKQNTLENPLTSNYVVRPGDTVETIARRHGINQREIIALNRLDRPNWIQVDQELKIPSANLQPTTSAPVPVRVQAAEPMVPPSPLPLEGLMLLTGSKPTKEQLSPLPQTSPQPRLPVANELVALNPPVRNNLALEKLTGQIAPPVQPTILSEQESKPVPPAVAVIPELAQEPQVIAAAPVLRNLPLSELAEQLETNATRPPTAILAPASESRMATQEVQKLEQEVEQLAVKLREAEVRQRQVALRLAAAAPRPSNPTRITPSSRLAPNNTPQLPSLTAKAFLPEVQDYGIGTGFIWPANGVLTSGFGPRWGRIHQGIDIAAPVGTPIIAAASGEVVFSGWNEGGFGYLVDILHPDGTLTRYAHNSALYVRKGEQVNQGQLIAAMGSTGRSTGSHLHFEIRPNGGAAIDPMVFLASARR